ncbi:hypothetical protein DL771_004569 [Monosporascus sp. 5C6A]|nr:hypothetical protein DL771_004569 [Monosporascus sp. 5C6A]
MFRSACTSLAPIMPGGTINTRAKAELEKRIPGPQEPEPYLVHGNEPSPVHGEYAQQDAASAVVLHLGDVHGGLDVGQGKNADVSRPANISAVLRIAPRRGSPAAVSARGGGERLGAVIA